METVIAILQNSVTAERAAKALIECEKGVENVKATKLEEVLQSLDPQQQTQVFLFLVDNLLKKPGVEKLQWLTMLLDHAKFIYEKKRFVKMCKRLGEWASKSKNQAIQLAVLFNLRKACSLSVPNDTSMSYVYLDFLKLCLLLKHYTYALPIAEQTILSCEGKANELAVFFYYAGLVFTGLKKYKKACRRFLQAITIPALAIHAASLESYKKLILLTLITEGELPVLPRYTSQMVNRTIRKGVEAYLQLAEVFKTYNVEKFDAFKTAHSDVFYKDQNWGLMKQLRKALVQRNLQRMTKTYTTLSLSAANIENPAEEILQMVEEGTLNASLDMRSNAVELSDQQDFPKLVQQLEQNINEIIETSQKAKEMSNQCSLEPLVVFGMLKSSLASVEETGFMQDF